jgi:hypothetical protein
MRCVLKGKEGKECLEDRGIEAAGGHGVARVAPEVVAEALHDQDRQSGLENVRGEQNIRNAVTVDIANDGCRTAYEDSYHQKTRRGGIGREGRQEQKSVLARSILKPNEIHMKRKLLDRVSIK